MPVGGSQSLSFFTRRVTYYNTPDTLVTMATKKRLSNLDIIDRVDVFPHPDKDEKGYAEKMGQLRTFVWEDATGARIPLGYAPKHVYDKLVQTPVTVRGEMDIFKADKEEDSEFTLFHKLKTEKERTRLAESFGKQWRDEKTSEILRIWRNEPWPVYGPDNKTLLFSMDRAAIGLFGFMRYGVHMTAFVKNESAPYGIKIWVPRRAKDKSTWPAMLDNTVAGGLMTGEVPLDCIVREADEEADFPEDAVRDRIKNVGTVTYLEITGPQAGGEGYIYPECQWVYDLELPEDIVPTPKDGEVDEFMLMTIPEIREHMAAGDFKPNCGLVMLDFFVRHGIVTRDNEPNFDEIVSRMHRKLPFPGPHKDFET